jgi:site-specific DNA-methyltransferase (adenine-specific)
MEVDTINNEDCLDTMSNIDNNFIDLVVTSPPYDNLRNYNGYSFNFNQIANELYRVIKEGGVMVWVVSDSTINGSETGTSFKQALYFKEIGFNLHDTMIYHKSNPVPVGGNNRYYQDFEYMFVLSKGKPKTFNPILRERRNKYNDKRTERVKPMNRNSDGKFTSNKKISLTGKVKLSNTWTYVVGGGNSVEYGIQHPATFPKKLVEDHILSWSNEGDLVYDPFMGSGTTAIMSIKHNRRYIGSEISKDYVLECNNRIKSYLEQ